MLGRADPQLSFADLQGAVSAFYKEVKLRLNEQRKTEIESQEDRVDVILKKKSGPIFLNELNAVRLYIDPNVTNEPFSIVWLKEKGTLQISVSPDVFDPKPVVFLGEEFNVVFVVKRKNDPYVSMDIENKIIYINPFNEQLSVYTLSILDVASTFYIILKIRLRIFIIGLIY